MAQKPDSSRQRGDQGPDDAFVTTIKRSYAWGRENSRVVTVGIAIIAVAVAAFFWYTTQQSRLEEQAAARFAQVQQTVASGNPDLAVRELRAHMDRFSGTETAHQARLILASILLQQDQAQEAATVVEDLEQDLDEPYGIAGARLRAAALEELGQVDQAVDTYLRIADNARFQYQRREALADAARVRLQNGDPEQAASLYQRVVDALEPESPQLSYYQMWLAEARAQAERGVVIPAEAADSPATDTTAPVSG